MTTAYIGTRRTDDVLVVCHPGGRVLQPERSLQIREYSPTGFEFGYRGSGPTQLALAILLDYFDDAVFADTHAQRFTDEIVANLGIDERTGCWTLTGEEIASAMRGIVRKRARHGEDTRPIFG